MCNRHRPRVAAAAQPVKAPVQRGEGGRPGQERQRWPGSRRGGQGAACATPARSKPDRIVASTARSPRVRGSVRCRRRPPERLLGGRRVQGAADDKLAGLQGRPRTASCCALCCGRGGRTACGRIGRMTAAHAHSTPIPGAPRAGGRGRYAGASASTQVSGLRRGAGERDRTAGLPFTRRPLCQLSYTGAGLAAC